MHGSVCFSPMDAQSITKLFCHKPDNQMQGLEAAIELAANAQQLRAQGGHVRTTVHNHPH